MLLLTYMKIFSLLKFKILVLLNFISSMSYEEFTSRFTNLSIAKKLGLKVGNNTRLYSTNFSTEPYLIEIGNNVTVSYNVFFITHDGGVWVVRNLYQNYKNINLNGKISIGNNVFIGINSTILLGVSISDNCIVAANSVVTKSVPKNSIVAGNPAKIIGTVELYIEKNKSKYVHTKNLSYSQRKRILLGESSKNLVSK